MTIYTQKRNGHETPMLVVEVTRHGHRMKATTSDRREALQIEKSMREGRWQPKDHALPRESSKDLHWLLHHSQVRLAGTGNEREAIANLERAVDIVGPQVLIKDLDTRDYDRLVAYLRKRPGRAKGSLMSLSTINRYLHALSAALEWASERGLEVRKCVIPSTKETAGPVFHFSPDEERELLEALAHRPDHQTCFRFLLATGMRVNELQPLTIKSFDMAMRLPGDMTLVKLWASDVKDQQDRSIPVPRGIAEAMLGVLMRDALPSYSSLKDALYRVRDHSSVMDKRLTLHSTRKTTATRMARRGVSTELRMKMLGHRSYKAAERYADHDLESLAKAALVLTE